MLAASKLRTAQLKAVAIADRHDITDAPVYGGYASLDPSADGNILPSGWTAWAQVSSLVIVEDIDSYRAWI